MFTINDIQIFIATHNRANYLKQTIECFLNQTLKPDEIIILDNESTDNTENIANSFKNKGVKYIKTFGFLGNYKKSKELACKKYVMLFHDDDILHPKYLETALKILNSHENISFITSSFQDFYNDDIPEMKLNPERYYYLFKTQKEFTKYLYFKGQIAYAPAIYRLEEYLENNIEIEKYGKHNDWPLMINCTKNAQSVIIKNQDLFFMRKHKGQDSESETNAASIAQVTNAIKLYDEILQGDLGLKNGLLWLLPPKYRSLSEKEVFLISKKYGINIKGLYYPPFFSLYVRDDRLFINLFNIIKTKLWKIYYPPKKLKID